MDYRFAIELLVPGAEYGWLAKDANDINGQYAWIDWRDKRKKPTETELTTAWDNYVAQYGTPIEQESAKEQKKAAALGRLQAKTDQNIIDLLSLLDN